MLIRAWLERWDFGKAASKAGRIGSALRLALMDQHPQPENRDPARWAEEVFEAGATEMFIPLELSSLSPERRASLDAAIDWVRRHGGGIAIVQNVDRRRDHG